MLSDAATLLADDHIAVDKVLTRLRTALKSYDVEGTHAALDLFWARLAVHIRAEHLHLFPTVLTRIENTQTGPSVPSLTEAESTVEQLRADHDFFMHELASAVAAARTLLTMRDLPDARAGLEEIGKTVAAVEQRLHNHNLIEEQKIYRWVGVVLNEQEQARLHAQIYKELANRPQRFAEEDW